MALVERGDPRLQLTRVTEQQHVGPSGDAAQARIRLRLRAKERKCQTMIESRLRIVRHVSTLPLQMGSRVTALRIVRRTSRPRDSQRG